jgi:hypothetical protein
MTFSTQDDVWNGEDENIFIKVTAIRKRRKKKDINKIICIYKRFFFFYISLTLF